ncbi:MAG: class I SAM-dependent methyltransferase [Microthrixaceae bacterium]|nr:class I SAM-dependent methyltransferase [Microthrixaceae bacterium]
MPTREYSELMIPMLLEHLEGHSRDGGAGGRQVGGPARMPLVLDVGTGEGQVARAVTDGLGWPVLGCDLSWTQVAEARRRGGGPLYLRCSATALALSGSSVDAVVACLLLEHVADLAGVLGELARCCARMAACWW